MVQKPQILQKKEREINFQPFALPGQSKRDLDKGETYP